VSNLNSHNKLLGSACITSNTDRILSFYACKLSQSKGDSPNLHNSYFFYIYKQIRSKEPQLLLLVGPKCPSGNCCVICFLTEKTGLLPLALAVF
jgi:hypothetical protein